MYLEKAKSGKSDYEGLTNKVCIIYIMRSRYDITKVCSKNGERNPALCRSGGRTEACDGRRIVAVIMTRIQIKIIAIIQQTIVIKITIYNYNLLFIIITKIIFIKIITK